MSIELTDSCSPYPSRLFVPSDSDLFGPSDSDLFGRFRLPWWWIPSVVGVPGPTFMTPGLCMKPRIGAIAVIYRDGLFLVIERSLTVRSPGMFCFPGGGVEKGEAVPRAVVRELDEELGITDAQPIRCLWHSENKRGTQLKWWLTQIPNDSTITPNPDEVASFNWWSSQRMLKEDRLLHSNREFLEAIERGEFVVGVSPT